MPTVTLTTDYRRTDTVVHRDPKKYELNLMWTTFINRVETVPVHEPFRFEIHRIVGALPEIYQAIGDEQVFVPIVLYQVVAGVGDHLARESRSGISDGAGHILEFLILCPTRLGLAISR